ncbi:PLD nuclease N-terminal domain-containing protein [Agathobacter sp.]|uniref:PLD nuclease N-terminal domain-containing protein n=1 Tax=Agathobacter sp. TaxID=2021311 RepID=UPI002582ED6A|nr:PLD nuclease N-terminal domain-containing protein [Agathobacter sp.]
MNIEMSRFMELLPILIPLIAIEAGLLLYGLIHVLTHKNYKCGNRLIWVLVVCLFSIVGPILYIILGKEDSASRDDDFE